MDLYGRRTISETATAAIVLGGQRVYLLADLDLEPLGDNRKVFLPR